MLSFDDVRYDNEMKRKNRHKLASYDGSHIINLLAALRFVVLEAFVTSGRFYTV